MNWSYNGKTISTWTLPYSIPISSTLTAIPKYQVDDSDNPSSISEKSIIWRIQ